MPVAILQKAPKDCKHSYDELYVRCCSYSRKAMAARETAERLQTELVNVRDELEDTKIALVNETNLRRDLQEQLYALKKRKTTDTNDSEFRKKVKTLLSKIHPDKSGTNTQFSSTEVTQLVTELL